MFGLRRINRRYRRFRYNNQARHPRLLVILDMLKLPLQLLAVALPLWIVVGIYNAQFSYDAKRDAALSGAEPEAASAGIDRETAAAVLDDADDGNFIVSSKQLEATTDALIQALPQDGEIAKAKPEPVAAQDVNEEPLLAQASPAPEIVRGTDDIAVKTVQQSVIEALPDDGTMVEDPLLTAEKDTEIASVVAQLSGPAQIHNEVPVAAKAAQVNGPDWLAEQVDTSFVIQIESSANHQVMQKRAKRLPASEDFTVYPFAVTDGGDVIYGLSYGLYETLSEAKQANAELPEDLVKFGTWIRQVGSLKQQMESIEPVKLEGW